MNLVRLRLPPSAQFLKHVDDAEHTGRFHVEDSKLLREWLKTKPFVCSDPWFIRFSNGSSVAGYGAELATVLSSTQPPKGQGHSINLNGSAFRKLLNDYLNPKKF